MEKNTEIKEIKEIKAPGEIKLKKTKGIGFKILFMSLVMGLLLIGLLCISGQLKSREQTYKSARYDIANSAGGSLNFTGPVIAVPYYQTWTENVYKDGKQFKETRSGSGYEIIQADTTRANVTLNSELRTVGIYSTPVFTGNAGINSTFSYSNLKDSGGCSYYQSQAVFAIRINNSSVMERPVFYINDTPVNTDLYSINGEQYIGAVFPVKEGKYNLRISLAVRGAEKISYTISSKETYFKMESDWPSPGFTNYSFLPDTRTINDNGFTAEWHIPFGTDNLHQYIGADLIESVNLYKKLHRALTYGFFFIIIPFLILFLFEIFAKIQLHPMHYLLSGAATVLFFLLLLAISEHCMFEPSYIIAALVASVTVSLYLISITKRYTLGIIMMGIFILLYSFLYFSLRSEDYALLLGSIFAFSILVGLMYTTRKVDWYKLERK